MIRRIGHMPAADSLPEKGLPCTVGGFLLFCDIRRFPPEGFRQPSVVGIRFLKYLSLRAW